MYTVYVGGVRIGHAPGVHHEPDGPAQDSVWINTKLLGNDKLIIGCIYRSLSSSVANDIDLNNQLMKICDSGDATHILIMGDFNYPNINWSTGSSSTNASDSLFMDTVNDCYLYQHVIRPTRARPNQSPNVLDLIFTNEDGMLSDLEFMAPLGKSDHSVLAFNLHCYVEFEQFRVPRRNYNKGDYQGLRNELSFDWNIFLDPLHNNVEAQFTVFHEKLMSAIDKFIPYYSTNTDTKINRPPMDKDVRKLIRRKNRLWTRYMETRDINKYREYCKCWNKARNITRRARKEFELQIALKARLEPKNFWKYANSKLKTRSNIPDLYTDTNSKQLTTCDQEKLKLYRNFSEVSTPQSLRAFFQVYRIVKFFMI